MKFYDSYDELSKILQETKDSNGVLYSSGGILSPYWVNKQGMFHNVNLGTNKNHLIRSVVENIAFRNADVIKCLERDFGQIG